MKIYKQASTFEKGKGVGWLLTLLLAMLLLFVSVSTYGMGLDFGGGDGGDPEPTSDMVMPEYERLTSVTPLAAPVSVAVDQDGFVYATDTYTNGLFVYSPGGKYLKHIDGLANPISVAVDEKGRIYVGNDDRGNVEIYDIDFTLLFKLGSGDHEFSQPNDIAIDPSGYIYVADKGKNIVSIYDSQGNYTGLLGGPGQGNGEFHHPLSIAIDKMAQEIIVLDLGAKARIQYFDLGGVFLRSLDRYGDVIGDMARPQHIAVDHESRLYVTDSLQNVVLVYDNIGIYLGVINDLDHSMRTPLGIAISESNRMYVASQKTRSIEVYGLYVPDVWGFTGMEIDPVSLQFVSREGDVDPSPQEISINNTGNVVLHWTATAEEEWISFSGESTIEGEIDPGQNSTIQLSVTKTGLEPGTYRGNITFIGNDRVKEVVEVVLKVDPGAILFVSLNTLSFVSDTMINPQSQSFTVANLGSAMLSWGVVADQPWISFDKPSGIITEDNFKDIVEVTVDVSGLPAGTHTGEVTVYAFNAAYIQPATISVNLTLNQTAHFFTLTAKSGEDGSLDPAIPIQQLVRYGETRSLTFNADEKCYVSSIMGCGIKFTNANVAVTSRTETTLPITKSCTVMATFATKAMRLVVSKIGNGEGKVTSALPGIDCPGDCQNLYDPGELVTLTAEPFGSSKFGGWTGDCVGTEFVCEVTMDQARSVEAKFTKFPWLILMPALLHNAGQQVGK